MNKKEIFTHYSALIDELLDRYMWMDTWFQNPGYIDMPIHLNQYDNFSCDFTLNTGATRACLIDEDYDWVVKFDIEEDNYGSACQREHAIYSDARAQNLSSYFTEVHYLGTYTKSYQFYKWYDVEQHTDYNSNYFEGDDFDTDLMEHEDEMEIVPVTISLDLWAYRRADPYDCGPLDKSLVASAQKVASPLRERNIAIAVAFIKSYGIDEYNRFSAFSMEHDINDIHFANIGKVDGYFQIIDYGGYHGTSIEDTYNLSWKKGA